MAFSPPPDTVSKEKWTVIRLLSEEEDSTERISGALKASEEAKRESTTRKNRVEGKIFSLFTHYGVDVDSRLFGPEIVDAVLRNLKFRYSDTAAILWSCNGSHLVS